jgi:PIN domain nuclease of toxin-antitoxin system
VSVWEVEIKRALGKLESPDGFADLCRGRGFDALDVNYDHATTAGQLPPHHADPFDRMLIAQAMIEGMVMLTQDAAFARYSVPCLDPAS